MKRSDMESEIGIRQGTILAGRFRIEKVLGTGGMGVVVAAHHLHLNTKVAIKFPQQEILGQPEILRRFMREAQAAAKIQSEHVARVLDVAVLENGVPFQVIEYLEGADLKAWLHQKAPLAVEQAVDFVLQTCEAIAEAHALGIIHRDLKPANLFFTRRQNGQPLIKVLDFGISKTLMDDGFSAIANGTSATQTGMLLGSPNYMSPEQLTTPRDIDPRTDIWSLGVILFELLTGRPPFNGETLPELSINIATQPAPSARSICSSIPDELDRIVSRCLRKAREERYQTVTELASALRPFVQQESQAHEVSVIATNHLEQSGTTLLTSAVSIPSNSEQSAAANNESHEKAASPNGPGSKLWFAGLALAAIGGVGLLGARLWGWHGATSNERTLVSGSPIIASPARSLESSPAVAMQPTSSITQVPRADTLAPDAGVLILQGVALAEESKPALLPAPKRPKSGPPHVGTNPNASNCSPPYTLDANGHKKLKLECF